MDVSIGGVEAYSTLGWFNDPIMNSMMGWGDERLATLIFELAHQRFYVKDDTEFNESFATFVEQEGTRQWRVARSAGDNKQAARRPIHPPGPRTRNGWKRSTPALSAERCARPSRAVRAFAPDYRQLRDDQWAGDKRYDAWINAPMNNARLLPFGLYDQWVPAFAALFKQEGGDWVRFYARWKHGALPVEQRKAALRQWRLLHRPDG
jgi:predicted aminopeptidase